MADTATGVTTARSWLPLLAVVGALGVSLGAIWLVAVPVGPEACALSAPGPRNCFTITRLHAAITPTILLALLAVASFAVAFGAPRSRGPVAALGTIVILVVAVFAYVAVAWIPALA